MTKRILLAVMSTLLVLVIVMSCIVFHKFSSLFDVIQNPTTPSQGTSASTPEPSASEEPTETVTTEPTDATEATQPTVPPETVAPTEPGHVHAYVKARTVAPTCTSYGYTVYNCSCGKTDIPGNEFVAPYGHNYVAGTPVAATCTTPGSVLYTCTNCQDAYVKRTQEATGHTFGTGIVTVPTCTEDGSTAYVCTVCSYEKKEDIVAASGHTFGEWELLTEPTDTAPGQESHVCSTCLETETRPIPPTGTLQITNGNGNGQVATKIDSNGKQYRHYIIIVGTQLTPNAYTYTIEYHVVGGVLRYVYSADGLVVTYDDGSGQKKTATLAPYQDCELVIRAEENGGTDPDDPITPTDPTAPTGTTGASDPTTSTGSEPTGSTSSEPTGGTEVSTPSDPTETTGPSEPTGTAAPSDPSDPTSATDVSTPTDPTQTTTASEPTEATGITADATNGV